MNTLKDATAVKVGDLVKDAAGDTVKAIVCDQCGTAGAPCPCGYYACRCVDCCPGEPPFDDSLAADAKEATS